MPGLRSQLSPEVQSMLEPAGDPEHPHSKRHVERYPLVEPVTFTWNMDGSKKQKHFGHTRDISVNSAFILSDVCPPVDSEISVELRLLLPNNPAVQLKSKVNGRVVRIEGSGFAFRSAKNLTFRRVLAQKA
jgi:hypothetical protein